MICMTQIMICPMRETVSNKQHTVRRLVRKRKHDWYNIPVRTAVVYTLVLNSSIQSKQAHLLVASLIHTSDYSTNVVERLDYSTTRWFNQSNLLSHRFIRYNHHEVIHPVPSIKRSLQRKLSTIYSISQLNAFFFNFYIWCKSFQKKILSFCELNFVYFSELK